MRVLLLFSGSPALKPTEEEPTLGRDSCVVWEGSKASAVTAQHPTRAVEVGHPDLPETGATAAEPH